MQIWIDIEDASGNKQGDGPIMTASGWTSTRRLDQAGTFSFTMPASDRRSNILAHKLIARCWAAPVYGEIREIGSGIIETIALDVGPDGGSVIRVSGDDLLRELANRTVGDLGLYYDRVQTPDLVKRTGDGVGAHLTAPFTFDLNNDPLYYLNIMMNDTTFNTITFTLGASKNNVTTQLKAQFYCVTSGGVDGWQDLTITDGTAVGGKPFKASGSITFDMPDGWKLSSDEGQMWYSLRLFADANLDAVDVTAITVTSREPTMTALADTMALAPAGWTLDTVTGLAEVESANGVYLQLAGESVLQTLIRIAELTGEHFALGFSGRRLRWLGTSQESSGLTALQRGASEFAEPHKLNQFAMYIARLSKATDSYELVTRLYPYGAGDGEGRVTLANTTRTAPADYVLSKTSNYLERTSAVATYGRIDARLDAPEITALDVSDVAGIDAANALYDRTYQELKRKSELQYAYDLAVVPSAYEVWPGQTIRVDYHEWVDGYHAVNIGQTLWILEVVNSVSSEGLQVIGLTVASVDYWPINDNVLQAKSLNKQETRQAMPKSEDGLYDSGRGIPTFLSIRNGKISNVRRVVPVANGTYDPVDRLVIEEGVITAVNP